MAYPQHSTPAPVAEDPAFRDALSDVFAEILEHAGPKREAKARRKLEAWATRLETYKGRHIPGGNVYPLRTTRTEIEREDEGRRRANAERAAHIRSLLARFVAEGRS